VTGRFVVLEGGDGSGKSTQCARLADRLRDRGLEVVLTVEPGGTELGRELRAMLLDGRDVDPRTETLLMAADRARHVAEVVRPALARDAWVVSDRHVPSSLVYQGVARGLGVDEVGRVSSFATGGLVPDLVVVLDVDDATADGRRAPDADRMEREGSGFHASVRAGYRELAERFGWIVVDGTGPPDEVTDRLLAAVDAATRS
jgi:dTMP kinase